MHEVTATMRRLGERMRVPVCAVLIFAGAVRFSFAGAIAPPMTVKVSAERPGDTSAVVPLTFSAPFPTSDLAPGTSHYLVSTDGAVRACQIEPLGAPRADLSYRWVNVTAALPAVDRTYTLLVARESLRPEIPLVGAALMPADSVALTSENVEIRLARWRLRLFESAAAAGRTIVPQYVEGLINRQQGFEMVVTDTFRHADFMMTPRMLDDGFRLDERGPVRASGVYSGAFESEYLDEMPFEMAVSLLSSDVVEVKITIAAGAFQEEVYDLKSVVVTLPLLLESAARLSFGGPSHNFQGAKRWRGTAALDVGDDGSYTFEDAQGAVVRGAGPLSWAHYGSDEGGAAFVWEACSRPVSVRVADYSQDLLEVALAPSRLESGDWQARLYIVFDAGARRRDLDALAQALASPPRAAVDERYVKFITKAR